MSTKPSRKSNEEGLVRVLIWLKMVPVASSPLFFIPIIAIKNPMPAAMAYFSEGGTMSKMTYRKLLIQSSMKRRPSMSTAVRANCHE